MHQKYIHRCFELAKTGLGSVSPNPMVGCVIVHQDRIIGEGYHKKFGGPHAEINALSSVSGGDRHLIPASTLYVNLEPCNHKGKTPPCSRAIVASGIKYVVIVNTDPNTQVAGSGMAHLRNAGITVEADILREEGEWLNRRFFKAMQEQKPYVILKWAESSDGFMASLDKQQVWFTSEESRRLVHKWRSEEDAVLIGSNTVEIDDPLLTNRYFGSKQPVRVVIDRRMRLPKKYKVFNRDASTLSITQKAEEEGDIEVIFDNDFECHLLTALFEQDIQSVIIEGGKKTLTPFIEKGLWDEARILTGKTALNRGILSPAIHGKEIKRFNLGGDDVKILVRQ